MQVYKVGGAVRDRLLGHASKDTDWLVVGASVEQMLQLGYRPVGEDFPVFLHPHSGEEYALARTERKTGHGYGGFSFYAAPDVSLEQDLQRRDLTINAMAEDADGNLYDPYGGRQDLEQRILRHVSPSFAEDPLRVLRVARFAARYAGLGFTVATQTMQLMRQLSRSGELQHLAAERIWQEISRALMEPAPEVFIQVLHDCGALRELLPEVDQLFGVPQRAEYHPEIDTGLHVQLVLQQCARHQHNLSVRWACLVHDLGKGITPGHILPSHRGHETAGVPLIKNVNQRLRVPKELAGLALIVGEQHLNCHRVRELRPKTLLRLLGQLDFVRRPQRLEDFANACTMDARGRHGFADTPYEQADYLRQAAQLLRELSIDELLQQGLRDKQLGRAIEQQRLAALAEFKNSWSANT